MRQHVSTLRARTRGVSPLVGFLLVFSFFTLASIGGSVVAVTTLNEAGSGKSAQVAEQSMRSVRAGMQDLAGGAPYRSIRADVQDSTLRYGDPITVRVEAEGPNGSLVEEVHPRPLVYDGVSGQVVYVAGAVMHQQDGGAVVETGPSYRISQSQAILSVVNTSYADGPESVGVAGDGVVSVVGYRWQTESRRFEPVNDTGHRVNATVTVTVETPRSEAWARWFRDHPRFGTVSASDGSVSATFETERLLVRVVSVNVRYGRTVA